MKKNNLITLKGCEKNVYLKIAPITMSKKGMKYFDNYPVITNDDHVWYVVEDGEGVVQAFCTTVINKTVMSIREVYIDPDAPQKATFKELLDPVMQAFEDSDYDTASCYTRAEHTTLWKEYGFEVTKEGKDWRAMKKEKLQAESKK